MSSTPLPTSIIDSTLASQRRNEFLTKKKAVLDGLIVYKPEVDHLVYPVPVFLELLNVLVKTPGQYSGLRVYFASHSCHADDPNNQYIPGGGGDTLTLIFVPTKEAEENGETVNEDDLDNCYIIAQNQLILLPKPGVGGLGLDTASRWVRHYQEKLGALTRNGVAVTGDKSFMDTKAQWYKMAIFTGVLGRPEPGLISYIKTLQSDPVNPLVNIVPQFACYTDTDTYQETDNDPSFPLQYQLTLLFELRQKNDPLPNPKPAMVGMRHHRDDQKRAAAAASQGGSSSNVPTAKGLGTDTAVAQAKTAVAAAGAMPEDSDTGFPCPPAICGGSKLPAS